MTTTKITPPPPPPVALPPRDLNTCPCGQPSTAFIRMHTNGTGYTVICRVCNQHMAESAEILSRFFQCLERGDLFECSK